VETVPQTVSIGHTFTHTKAPLPKITWSYRGAASPSASPLIRHCLQFAVLLRYLMLPMTVLINILAFIKVYLDQSKRFYVYAD